MEADTPDWLSERREKLRAWSELVDKTCFTKPSSVADVKERIAKNWAHFESNYLVVGFCLSLLLALGNKWEILVIALSIAGFLTIVHKMTSSVIIAGVEMKPATAKVVWIVISLLSLWWYSVTNSFIYVLLLTALVIGGHAAIYEQPQPDNLGEKV